MPDPRAVRTCIACCVVMVAGMLMTNPGSAAANGTTPESGLGFRIELDRSEYLLAEPVLLGLSIENRTPTPFRDLASLNPYVGFVAIEVTREGTVLEWTARHDDYMMLDEGSTLAPGQAFCELADLGECYGTRATFDAGGKTFSRRRLLPPGLYAVRARFKSRTGVVPGLPQVLLESNELQFRVSEAGEIPPDEISALEMIQEMQSHWKAAHWTDVQDRGLERSRYVVDLGRLYVRTGDDVDVLQMASSGVGRLACARMLRDGWERMGWDVLEDSKAWLGKLQKDPRAAPFSCFLDHWQDAVARAQEIQDREKSQPAR